MHERYKARGLVVLGIGVPADIDEVMRAFVDVFKVSYPVGRDTDGAIVRLYAVDYTPTSLFIDKAGRLVEQHVGELEKAEFVKWIDALLK
jgi:hypothetical protein